MLGFSSIAEEPIGANGQSELAGSVINLIGANCSQASTSSTGAVTVTPGAAVINLVGSPCSQSSTSSSGAVTVIPAPKTINLIGADCAQASMCSTGAVTVTQNTYARAPAGAGYVPKRHECGCRPFVTQRNHR